MTIWIDNRTENPVFKDYQNTLNTVVKKCLEEEKYFSNVEVSISIVDNQEIEELNKQFRNIDSPTDVLSFPMLEFGENGSKNRTADILNMDTNEVVLGDIIISIDKALEQSIEFGHSIQREVAFLTAHSMFHLMGYDHETIQDEAIMKQKQEKILTELNLTR